MRNVVLALTVVLLAACSHRAPPSHAEAVDARGDAGMGFSHEKTTHHFRLLADGGAIEVQANDPADGASRDMIRMHLQHIAGSFASGDFDLPMFVHGQTPPGVPVMKEKKGAIAYTYEELPAGARVRIKTADPEALSAVHDFLKFQIQDHRTGDPLAVQPG
jgi:hypothetical protein